MVGQLPREQLEDLSLQRLQENVGRQFSKIQNAKSLASIGSNIQSLGNLTYSVSHALGKEVSGFIILSQTSSGSIKASLVSSTGTDATLSFDSDPGTFTVSFF